jgi:hypothetical protein
MLQNVHVVDQVHLAHQASLFDRPPIETPFQKFHRENSHVYRVLRDTSLEEKRSGRYSASMKYIYEVVRRSKVQTNGHPYKLNNNFTSHYSRLLMESEPELRGFFEVRGK